MLAALRRTLAGWWQHLCGRAPLPRSAGAIGEELAAAYLRRQGYEIVARNVRTRWSELDLVALHDGVIIFVEVKTRRDRRHGLPVEAVTRDKQRRISRAAVAYLKRRGWMNRPARFDVVSVEGPLGEAPPQITHYCHAFEYSGE